MAECGRLQAARDFDSVPMKSASSILCRRKAMRTFLAILLGPDEKTG